MRPVLWLRHLLRYQFALRVDRSSSLVHNAKLPEYKSLYALWELHGAEGPYKSDPVDERLLCLEPWLDTLYGPGTQHRVGFRNRHVDLKKRQSETHAAGVAKGQWYSFKDPFVCVLEEVSDELGDYSISAQVRAELAVLAKDESAAPPSRIQF